MKYKNTVLMNDCKSQKSGRVVECYKIYKYIKIELKICACKNNLFEIFMKNSTRSLKLVKF